MKCTSCGAEVGEGARFCEACGTPVSAQNRCAACGAELEPVGAFCSSCGAPISGRAAPRLTPVPPPAQPQPARQMPSMDRATASAPPYEAGPASGPEIQREPRRPRGRPVAAARGIEFKGIVPRFLASLIDGVLYFAFSAFMASRFGSSAASTSAGFQFDFNLQGPAAAVTFAVAAAYYVLLEGYLGGTVGKLLLGIRVVNGHGRAPGPVPALIRNVLRFVDFLPFAYLFGILLVATSREKQRLGDRVAGTFVVSRSGAAAMRESDAPLAGAGSAVPIVVGLLALILAGGGYWLQSQPGGIAAQLGSIAGQSAGSGTQPAPSKQAASSSPTQAATRATAAPTQAAGQGSGDTVDMKGDWKGTVTITDYSASGLSPQDQQRLAGMKGQSRSTTFTFEPSGPNQGTVKSKDLPTEGPPPTYRLNGGVLTFTFANASEKAEWAFEGRPTRKGSGYSIDGTFKASAPGPSPSVIISYTGTWTATR